MPTPSRIAVVVNRGLVSVFREHPEHADVFQAVHPQGANDLEWDEPFLINSLTGSIVPGKATIVEGERAERLELKLRGIPPKDAAAIAAEFIKAAGERA